jgi:hypothetical protein
MLPIFKDKKLQEQFECEGFVKLNLFTVRSDRNSCADYYDTVRQQHEAANASSQAFIHLWKQATLNC